MTLAAEESPADNGEKIGDAEDAKRAQGFADP